jgi:hypothetical protein
MPGLIIVSAMTAAIQVASPLPPTLQNAYEPSAAHPFGQRNPDAAEALDDYEFMVGYFACNDVRTNPGQEPVAYSTEVRGQYYLNGHGFINHTYSPRGVGVMTYSWNPDENAWVVDYTAAPAFARSTWHEVDTGVDGEQATETPGGQPGVMIRSVFLDQSSTGFSWRLDAVTPQGRLTLQTSECRRVI